jgi:hypothetical protein
MSFTAITCVDLICSQVKRANTRRRPQRSQIIDYYTIEIGSSRMFDLELTCFHEPAIVVGVSMHVLLRAFTFFYVHLRSFTCVYVLLHAFTFFCVHLRSFTRDYVLSSVPIAFLYQLMKAK